MEWGDEWLEYDELACEVHFGKEAVSDVASRGRGTADATSCFGQHDGTAQTVDDAISTTGWDQFLKVVWATLEDWRPGLDSLPQLHAACWSAKQLPYDDVFKVFHE